MAPLYSTRNLSSTRKLPRIVVGATVGLLLSVVAAACSDNAGTPTDGANLTGTQGGATNDSTPRPAGPLAGIGIYPGALGMQVGSVATLIVNGVDATGHIVAEKPAGTPTFVVANAGVAVVTPAGKVTGISVGNTTIDVTWGAFKKSVGVFVSAVSDSSGTPGGSLNAIAGINVSPKNLFLQAGGAGTVSAFPVDANGVPTLALLSGNPTWASGNILVATVDANGRVKAVAAGTTTVTAAWGTYTASTNVVVHPDTTGR